jgi:2-amino-4-hydroxy-6-hydroxymethyldihydropteridine diphosphokinase/dihydropteroate synthase
VALAVFGLGSNLGNKKSNILQAKILLKREFSKFAFLFSASNYTSNAIVKDGSPEVFSRLSYINSAIAFDITLSPALVFKKIKKIERKMGRKKRERWAPRKIDIDILIYEGNEMETPSLTIPHKELFNREFALIPLREILNYLGRSF